MKLSRLAPLTALVLTTVTSAPVEAGGTSDARHAARPVAKAEYVTLVTADTTGGAPTYLGRHAQARQAAQRKLHAMGLYDGPIDGSHNLVYQAALRAYQTAHHLAPTGRLNHETGVALGI